MTRPQLASTPIGLVSTALRAYGSCSQPPASGPAARERPLLRQLGSTLLARIRDELLRAESRRPKGADERRRSLSVLTSALSGACRNANSLTLRISQGVQLEHYEQGSPRTLLRLSVEFI